MATREDLLSQPRSGVRPLGNSDPGPGRRPAPAAPRPAPRDGAAADTLRQARPAPTGRGETPSRPGASSRNGRQSPARRGARKVRTQYRQHVTTNYERVIVAEFVVVVILVAAAPFTRKNRDGLSPYYGQDLVQLVAIMAAYFILGLVAQGGHSAARVAAWFGGLLAVGIGLGEAAYLAKVFDLFGAASKQAAAAGSSSGEITGPQDAGAAPTQTGA